MQRIETRTQLINFICKNIKQSAIVRACHSPNAALQVQVAGGFLQISPATRKPGWIVAVTSLTGLTWLVAVWADDFNHVFRTCLVESIPWQFYTGRSERGEYSIYDGDNPQQACLAREIEIENSKIL